MTVKEKLEPFLFPFFVTFLIWLSVSCLSATLVLDLYPMGAIAFYGALYGAMIGQIILVLAVFFYIVVFKGLKRISSVLKK
jgi:hypothetical protein